MALLDFFKPKWLRIKAVGKIGNQALLAKIAVEDENWNVTRAAVKRVTDQALLAKIAIEDYWNVVTRAAVERVTDQALLARIAAEAKHTDVCKAAVERVTDQALLAKIAIEARWYVVTRAAVERVTDQALLARMIFIEDEDWRVREAAVKRVTDQALLAKIATEDREASVRIAAVKRVTDQALLAKIAAARAEMAELPVPPAAVDVTRGKLIIVIDDDALVLDSMGGLLRNWGCRVVAAATPDEALVDLGPEDRPDLIISDFHLANSQTGITDIAKLREAYGAPVPAFLMSGNTTPECLREARESGHHLLHKPCRAMALRDMINRLLKSSSVAGAA